MPEIGECYTIAQKIPELGEVVQTQISPRFYRYIDSSKTLKKLLKQPFFLAKPIAYGKSLWFTISQGNHQGILISQLGMTGSWFLGDQGREPKNDHLTFQGLVKLRYSDPRMFGKMKFFWLQPGQTWSELEQQIIKQYRWGIDPYQSSIKQLVKALTRWQKSQKNIKTLMLEQNILFGIGNYLASEILFASKISPYRLGSDLQLSDLQNLAINIKKIVKLAIKTGGYSFAAGYYHPDGSVGTMAKQIKVYEQTGHKCSVCRRAKIKKVFINSRSTYYCPSCQKK